MESGREIYRRGKKFKRHLTMNREIETFNNIFGTVPFICSLLWTKVDPLNTICCKSHIVHLLWALLLMNDYSTEVINASYVGVDVDTQGTLVSLRGFPIKTIHNQKGSRLREDETHCPRKLCVLL